MTFAMPEAMYPFLADRLHHPGALGLLYSAGGVGAVLATQPAGLVRPELWLVPQP